MKFFGPAGTKRVALSASAVLAIVLALAAAASACTPSLHNFTITPNSGLNQFTTYIEGSGLCLSGSIEDGCNPDELADTNLYQDLTPTVPVSKSEYDHQFSCNQFDTDIGSSSIDFAGNITASGTTATRVLEGAYIICSGIDPDALYDFFIMT